MRNSARAIIIENGKLLTMFRRKIKDGKIKEYYVIPGGGIEEGETPLTTVVRELKEELNIDIKVLGFLGKYLTNAGEEYYYHCKIENGKPELGGEELDRMTPENYYEPRYVSLEKLGQIDIYGKEFVSKANEESYEK